MTMDDAVQASPSAARLPIESKAEKRKRRAEKQLRREEKRRRREEKHSRRAQGVDVSEDVTQDTTQDVTREDEQDEDMTHSSVQNERPRQESDDLEDEEEEARLAQRSEAKRLKKLEKARRKQHKQQQHDDDAADVSLVTRPQPAQAQPPSSPHLSASRNPFAPSSSAPNPFARSSPALASSPPFYPRGGMVFNSQPLPDHGTRFSSVDPSYESRTSSPVAASPALPYDPSDFPPGSDMSALDQDSNNNTASSTRRTRTSQPTGAALDAALRSQSAAKGTPTAARGRVKTIQGRAQEGITNSKEGTIVDATGLTEKQILSEKLYVPHQIKWLQEAGLLTTVHRGKYSKQEDQTMRNAMTTWCDAQGLSQSEAIELIHNRTHEQAQMYADLTSYLAASLDGRSLRSVRRFVLENFHQAKTGTWSEEEVESLRTAYAELGPKWSLIAQRLNRLSRDVRVKHRDYIAVDTRRPTQQDDAHASTAASTLDSTLASSSSSDGVNRGKWTQSEMRQLETVVREQCAALSLDIDGTNLPWKAIAATVNRSTHSCIDQWDKIRARQRKGTDPFETATRDESYLAPRDDLTLVRRVLDRQADELQRNDAKLIHWSRIIDGPDDDGLPFSRKTVSKAFTRLVTRLRNEILTNSSSVNPDSIPLSTLLQDHALPSCETAHSDWATGTHSRPGNQTGRTWSNERKESRLQANAGRRAEKEAQRAEKAAMRLAKKQEKERKREEREVNARATTTRKGTKAAQMKMKKRNGSVGGGGRDEDEDEGEDEGDRIGSDEE